GAAGAAVRGGRPRAPEAAAGRCGRACRSASLPPPARPAAGPPTPPPARAGAVRGPAGGVPTPPAALSAASLPVEGVGAVDAEVRAGVPGVDPVVRHAAEPVLHHDRLERAADDADGEDLLRVDVEHLPPDPGALVPVRGVEPAVVEGDQALCGRGRLLPALALRLVPQAPLRPLEVDRVDRRQLDGAHVGGGQAEEVAVADAHDGLAGGHPAAEHLALARPDQELDADPP